ncbi:hypothetical protein [Demequina sp.]|uniref:hypothetical protein n=1 Tax=Demequina sp. TaxID=2050685 RepID=UPI003D0B5DD5
MADTAVLSRRRLLVGAAWAAPVVLVATAVPAAAASTTPGAVALTSLTSTMTATNLYVRGQVAYAGAVSPSPDAPVDTVRMQITVLRNRVTEATAPVVSGSGWAYVGPPLVTGSGNSATLTYTFSWTSGTPLRHNNLITPQLVVTFAKPSSVANLNVSVVARGVSLAVPVQVTQTVATTRVGTLSFVQSAANRITYVASRNVAGVGAIPVYRFRGTLRNTGAAGTGSRPVAAPISSLKVEIAIPAAYTTGARYDYSAGSVGAGWTLTSGPTLSSGVWRLTYTYSGAINAASNSTVLDFVMRAASAKALGHSTLVGAGTSEQFPVSVSQAGPTV